MIKNIIFSLACAISIPTFAQQPIPNDDKVKIQHETVINTEQVEFSPAFYEDGIVFISTKKVEGKNKIFDNTINHVAMSIFLARRDISGTLREPEPFSKDLISDLHEGPISFDRTNETVFFSRNDSKDGKNPNFGKDGIARTYLYSSTKHGAKWTEATPLPFNDPASDAMHPSLSPDGDELYFASNRAGGFGGMDLYVCQRKIDGSWGTPTNLGATINTDKNEVFPFIHADGTLYFASDSPKSSGGFDIFIAKSAENGKFLAPKNLGKPYNSEKDDFGFIVDLDNKNGYFSSNRSGTKGEDDIYSFHTEGKVGENLLDAGKKHLESDQRELTFIAIDKDTGKEIGDVAIEITHYNETTILSQNPSKTIQLEDKNGINKLQTITPNTPDALINGSTKDDGKFTIVLLKENNYLLNANKENYQTKQIILNKEILKERILIVMEKIGSSITIEGIALNKKRNPMMGATVAIKEEVTGTTQNFVTDRKGHFSARLPCGKTYQTSASQGNYVTPSEIIEVTDADCEQKAPVIVAFNLTTRPVELTEGISFDLPNIYFNFNDASLRPDALKDLDALVVVLRQHPNVEIELSSHTDSRGTEEYNLALSQRRANSVTAYLIKQGILPERLKPVGYGESRLRNECKDGIICTNEQHQQNRRTEVKVLSMKPNSTLKN